MSGTIIRPCAPSLGDEGFTDSLPPLTTLLGLAHLLRLNPRWLRGEADGGRIPSLRAGRRRLFHPAAVVRALAERAERGEALPQPECGRHDSSGCSCSSERGGGL